MLLMQFFSIILTIPQELQVIFTARPIVLSTKGQPIAKEKQGSNEVPEK